jgi:hypothetical protein
MVSGELSGIPGNGLGQPAGALDGTSIDTARSPEKQAGVVPGPEAIGKVDPDSKQASRAA